jgi:hypothetical protein
LGRKSHRYTSRTISSLHVMQRSRKFLVLVWRYVAHGVVLIRDVPLKRDIRMNVRTPYGIGRT